MGISFLTKQNEEKANQLLKKLTRSNDNLEKIIFEISTTNQTSNIYWGRIQAEIIKEYDKAKIIINEWAVNTFPQMYNRQIKQEIARLNKLKTAPLKKVSSKVFVNSNANKQSIKAILEEFNNTMNTGLLSGQNTMLRLARLTQQINVIEGSLESAVGEGFDIAGNAYGAKKATRNELLKKSLDGKYITVINKNGQMTQWKINTYADLVARTKLQDNLSNAIINTTLAVGSDLIQVSSHNTTTEICQQYEGKIFSLSGKDKDFPVADNVPAYHVNCYEKEVSVLTDKGLKNISELEKGDICFSLNIESKTLEKAKVIRTFKNYEKQLINFKNKYFDISVTKNHNMLYSSDWNHKYNNDKLIFKKAIDLYKNKKGVFYCGCEWEGKEEKKDLFIEFMGYYLSEGSISKHSRTSYMIRLSQSRIKNKKKYNIILNCVQKLFPDIHLCLDDGGIRFINQELNELLIGLGKSSDKHIPGFIKNSSKHQIRIFLDAFCLGDGHIKKGKEYKSYKFSDSKSYFTSSNKMANDIIELLLKVGKRPSYREIKTKGKEVEFKNGKYKINNNIHEIRECNNLYYSFQSIKSEIIEYNDYVYCVELDKNNTLYVNKDGRFLWCGNCKHSITTVIKEGLEVSGTLDKYIAFSNGETGIHPTRKAFIPVKDR